MKHKIIVLLSVIALLSLVIAPVGTVGAQAEDPGVAPDCPPIDPASSREQAFMKSLSPDCAKIYRELIPGSDNNTSMVNITPTLVGGPDDFGYTFNDTGSNSWTYAYTNSGLVGDDNYSGPIDIGFSFPLYGVTQTQHYLSNNGFIYFGQGYYLYSNGQIPLTDLPNNFIAPFWDDIRTGPIGAIFTLQGGTAPNRYFVVEWRHFELVSGSGNLSFEAILHENGDIVFQYSQVPVPGNYSSTVGIENSLGDDGLIYLFGGSFLSPYNSIRF
jgi:hypothetical protein